jgi:hypothetical protein
MKKCLWAGLLGLAFFVVPHRAHADGCGGCCGPWQINTGINFCFRVSPAGPAAQAGPWYLYWPLEAHFGPPAPTGYPYWPASMTLPTQGQPAPISQTGYYSPAPSYWYSH